MSTGLIALLISLAVLLSATGAILAAVDAAFNVSSRGDLEELAERYPRRSAQILLIAEDRTPHLNAVNFVRVTAETFSAVLITVILSSILSSWWATLLCAAIIMSLVTFVLVGASPRSVGTHYPDFVVRATARLVRALRIILGPIATALVHLGKRLSPGRGAAPGRIRDEQQLLSMVDRAAEQDLLEEEEQDYIHSLVEFGETVVREVMIPRTDMVTIDASNTVSETLETLLNSRHSRIPVTDGDSDDVVGVAYLRDVSGFIYRRPDEAQTSLVTRIMKPAQFVPDLQRADELMRQMQRNSNHLALAVDEYGGIAGLVTLEDLIEELVGEISDEHDRETPDIVAQSDGSYQVSARLGIEELGELYGRELEDEDAQTVGGLIAKHLGRLADEGDSVVVEGIELTALQTERKRQRLLTVQTRWVGGVSTATGTLKLGGIERAATAGSAEEEGQRDD